MSKEGQGHSVTFGAQVSDLEAKTQMLSTVLELSKKSALIASVDKYTSASDDEYKNTTVSHFFQGLDWDNYLAITIGTDSNEYSYKTATVDLGRSILDLMGYNLITRFGIGLSAKKTEKTETDDSDTTTTYEYIEDLLEKKVTASFSQDLSSKFNMQLNYSKYAYTEESTIVTTASGSSATEAYDSGLDRIEFDYMASLSSFLGRKWIATLSYSVASYEAYTDQSVDYGVFVDFQGSRSYTVSASYVLNQFDSDETTYGLSLTITNPKALDF